jgi:hypothetical protein
MVSGRHTWLSKRAPHTWVVLATVAAHPSQPFQSLLKPSATSCCSSHTPGRWGAARGHTTRPSSLNTPAAATPINSLRQLLGHSQASHSRSEYCSR